MLQMETDGQAKVVLNSINHALIHILRSHSHIKHNTSKVYYKHTPAGNKSQFTQVRDYVYVLSTNSCKHETVFIVHLT